VSGTWRHSGTAASLRGLAQELEQVRIILDKIDLLLKNIDALSDMDEANKRLSMRPAEAVPLSFSTSATANSTETPPRLPHPGSVALKSVALESFGQDRKHG
jgi:hypothetical protein